MRTFRALTYKDHQSHDWVYYICVLSLFLAALVAFALFLPVFSSETTLSIMKLLMLYFAFCLLVLAIKIRRYPLVLQDRIIRIEMRLRLEKLLPIEEHWQINGLSNDQMIALRFADDEELLPLMRKVLDEFISDREQIKRMIKRWKADPHRI